MRHLLLLVIAWLLISPAILLLVTFNTLFLWNTSLPWALARGIAAVTVHPPDGSGPASQTPPRSRARSVMPVIPRPAGR